VKEREREWEGRDSVQAGILEVLDAFSAAAAAAASKQQQQQEQSVAHFWNWTMERSATKMMDARMAARADGCT
jgi:hypothetical protein